MVKSKTVFSYSILVLIIAVAISGSYYIHKNFPLSSHDINADLTKLIINAEKDNYNLVIVSESIKGSEKHISYTFNMANDDTLYYGHAVYEKSLLGTYRMNGTGWSSTPFDL